MYEAELCPARRSPLARAMSRLSCYVAKGRHFAE